MKSQATSLFSFFVTVSSLAHAETNIQVSVRYWHPVKSVYAPAAGIGVTVEIDALGQNRAGETDESGKFVATVAEAIVLDGVVVVRAAAERPSLHAITSDPIAFGPYEAVSKPSHLAAGSQVAVELSIGGPDDNVGEVRYGAKERLAEAFHAAVEMSAVWRWFKDGFGKEGTTSPRTIFFPSPVEFSSREWIGLKAPDGGFWAALAPSNPRHIYAHKLIEDVFALAPKRIGSVGFHGESEISDPGDALREAMAIVLDCLSLGTACEWPKPSSAETPAQAALRTLMAIAQGIPDATVDLGEGIPAASVRLDGLDPKFEKICGIVRDHNPTVVFAAEGDVEDSLVSFWLFATEHGKTHELRAILNRLGLTLKTHPQNAPAVKILSVSKPKKVGRAKNKDEQTWRTTIEFEIAEVDAEDRAFVKWALYFKEVGEGKAWSKIAEGGWKGDTNAATMTASVTHDNVGAFEEGEEFRAVVHDEMAGANDVFKVPEKWGKKGETPAARGAALAALGDKVAAKTAFERTTPEAIRERRRATGLYLDRKDDLVAPIVRAAATLSRTFGRAHESADEIVRKIALAGATTKQLSKSGAGAITKALIRTRSARQTFGRVRSRASWSESFNELVDRFRDGLFKNGWIPATDRDATRTGLLALVAQAQNTVADIEKLGESLKGLRKQFASKEVVAYVAKANAEVRTRVEAIGKALSEARSWLASRTAGLVRDIEAARRALAGMAKAIK